MKGEDGAALLTGATFQNYSPQEARKVLKENEDKCKLNYVCIQVSVEEHHDLYCSPAPPGGRGIWVEVFNAVCTTFWLPPLSVSGGDRFVSE